MTVPQVFDSLIAKLIVTGASRTEALQRAARALAEFEVGGMPTVLPFHRAVVADPAFAGEPLRVHTRWIETEFAAPMPAQEPAEAAERARPGDDHRGGGREDGCRSWCPPRSSLPRRRPAAVQFGRTGPWYALPAQGTALAAATRWSARCRARSSRSPSRTGSGCRPGDVIVVLEAMKMEQPLTAHKDGTVTGLAVAVGQTVTAGAPICELKD